MLYFSKNYLSSVPRSSVNYLFVLFAFVQVVASNKLEPLLGVFQKLVASKLNDHEGFYLLQSLVEFLPAEIISNYVKSIFTLVSYHGTSGTTVGI